MYVTKGTAAAAVAAAVVLPAGHDTDSVIKHAALSANTATQEAIDVVLFEAHPGKDTLWGDYTLKKFVPFNPVSPLNSSRAALGQEGTDSFRMRDVALASCCL
jgi:hypothetical protein